MLAAILCLSSSGFGFAGTSGAASTSATALLASAIHDGEAARGVHEVSVAKHAGETLKMVNDIGTNGGRQMIKLSDGSVGEVIAFDSQSRAYIKGNKVGLRNYFAFPESAATKYSEKWMVANPGDQAWDNITGFTTLKSDFGNNLLILHPALRAKLATINGVDTYEITGTVAATANGPAASVKLYVSDKGTVLPIRLTERAKGISATVNWSEWGESIALRAPPKYVPLP
ncbi:MAG: hypothetical protein WCF25_06305 [Acidimicrobiales bacterium]